MAETIFTSLVVAAISGLTYLAVVHHAVYEKLFSKLYLTLGVVCLCVAVWGGAVSMTLLTLLPFIQDDKASLARAAADGLSIHFGWLLLIQFGAMGYLFFLSWLGGQIKQDKEAKSHEG